MKTTKIAIAAALATCAGTQLFAQNKEDVITFSLTGQKQMSVSTSATVNNAGNWSDEPHYYKTATTKVTDKDIIKFIAYVKHGNANYYSSKAQLVMVQGELSGFFNITPDLGDAIPHNHNIDGSGLSYGVDGFFYVPSGYNDDATTIGNSTDSSYVTMANGRHLDINPIDQTLYPVGHLQPWGQIFIKDTGGSHTVDSPLCENVTYYFAMSVEECYDCFYMNSFISDATFTVKTAQQSGPPCCGTSSVLLGKGKDRYYLTLSFDNTENNPYLNPHSNLYVQTETGIGPDSGAPIPGDAIVPDLIDYNDKIATLVGKNLPYEARFTLNGILTYTWNLKFLNSSDIAPDFLGTATYAANGYGFIALYCQLLTGSATFTEKAVRTACCLDTGWWDEFGGWYGVGAEYYDTEGEGGTILDQTKYSSGNYPTPLNVGASLSYHHNFDMTYPWAQNNWGAGWPTPAIIEPAGQSLVGANVGWSDYGINQY